jgi:hypothetical protein
MRQVFDMLVVGTGPAGCPQHFGWFGGPESVVDHLVGWTPASLPSVHTQISLKFAGSQHAGPADLRGWG